MKSLLIIICVAGALGLAPLPGACFQLPPPPGNAGAPSHGGPPQYDRPGSEDEVQDALDQADQQLPPSDLEQSGVDVVYYASHTQGQGLGQVFGQFWNIGQDAMSTYLYYLQPGATGSLLASSTIAGGMALGQVVGQAGTIAATLDGLPSGFEAYVPRRWNYAGPGWTSGHDQFWGDQPYFDGCMQYWVNAGLDNNNIRACFEADRAAAGPAGAGCFMEPAWGTPDECAYVHDMDYKRAGSLSGRAKDEAYIMADLKLIACVQQFTSTLGSRHGEYLAMSPGDQAYAEAMVVSFEAMVAGRTAGYMYDVASQVVDEVQEASIQMANQAAAQVTQLGQAALETAGQMASAAGSGVQTAGAAAAGAAGAAASALGQAVTHPGQTLDTAADLACRYLWC